MALDKGKIAEKLKSLTPEDRTLFRETLLEIDPPENTEIFTGDEIKSIRDILSSVKEKKEKKNKVSILDSIFGTLE